MSRLAALICVLGVIAIASSVMPHPTMLPIAPLAPVRILFDHTGYQGRITLSDGSPIADGPHSFVFTLHDHETANSPVWSESRTEPTTDGLLSVRLGESVPLTVNHLGSSTDDTTRVLYLEITVDGEVISPRTKLVSTPYANIAERLLGDVDTDPGLLVIRDPVTNNPVLSMGADNAKALNAYLKLEGDTQSNVEMNANAGGGTLTVSNIGSSGQDGVRFKAEDAEAALEIVYENLSRDTLGGFGTFVTSQGGRSAIKGRNPFTGEEIKIETEALPTISGKLKISNLGSSGEDGVSIDVGPNEPFPASSKLFVGGLSLFDRGTMLYSDEDSSQVDVYHNSGGGSGGRIAIQTTDSKGHLTISNIGSSGQDGVSIEAGGGTATVGIEHEDIGVRMHTGDEGSGPGMSILDGTGDSTIYAMNKAELVESVAGNVQTTRVSSEGLVISNIGSSGQDGVSIVGGGGGGGRIALRSLSSGQIVETEMVAMSLTSTEPVMVVRQPDAAPLDPGIFRLEYDANDRIIQRFTSTPTAPGDSSELHSSGLHLYDGIDRIFVGTDVAPKMQLKRLQSGQTVETEIIAMSLSGSDPPISIRMPDALPFDIPLTTYEYDFLDRRILHVQRSETGQAGDSSRSSSTGLHLFDAPREFKFDISGIQFSDATGSPFSVSPSGDLDAAGNGTFALLPTSGVGIGGTFPGVKLFVDGDICATGAIGPCSDIRYKKNIATITDPIKKVLRLRGVSFDWRTDAFPNRQFEDQKQLGLIAQEVKEILPEIVGEGDDGYQFVDYSRLTPVLIEAIKAQQKEIEELKRMVYFLVNKSDGSGTDEYGLK